VEIRIPEGREAIIVVGEKPNLVPTGGSSGGGGSESPPPPNLAIALAKIAEPTRVHDGDNVTYTYTVTNTGEASLSFVTLIDDKGGNFSFEEGDVNTDGNLDTDESWVFTASYNVTSEDATPLVNTANVSGTDALSRTVAANASASVDILRPLIAIVKAAEPGQGYEGNNVTYTYTVTNPGNTPLSAIAVTDDKAGEASYHDGDINADGYLDTDESWVFSANYTVMSQDANPLVNTANVSGTDALSWIVTANASANVSIIRGYAQIEVDIPMPIIIGASVYIWDDTENRWATDGYTLNPIDGTNHTTPTSCPVAFGHHYTVWIEKEGYIFAVATHPEEWDVTPDNDKAYGRLMEAGASVYFAIID
jgi:uncharacterized repeat protein (TIGR01451 family)